MTKLLENGGLSSAEAQTILELAIYSKSLNHMKERFDDSVDEYPEVLLSTIRVVVKIVAVEWIDENKPDHWARPVFAK